LAFFFNETRASAARNKSSAKKHIPIESMRAMGCKACPLDKVDTEASKTEASGVSNPIFYLLEEQPAGVLDRDARKASDYLKAQFSSNVYRKDVRQSHVTHCSHKDLHTPAMHEIECCRGFTVKDIEDTKPLVIIGAGKSALQWATGINSAVNDWRGQLIATKIGNHACWYYPVYDPAWVLDKQGKYGPSVYEKVFENDFKQLLKILPDTPPICYEAPFDTGLELITGQAGVSDWAKLETSLNDLLCEPELGYDIETIGLRPYFPNSKIIMAAFGTFDRTVVFPLDHPEGWSTNYRKKVWGLFHDFIVQSGRKICHSLAFEMEWSAFFLDKSILRKTEWEDTLAMAHTLREVKGTLSLDDLTREYFGFFLKDQSKIDLKNHLITDYPIMEALRYNGMDAKWTHLLKQNIQPRLNVNPKYVEEYERKVRLAPTLVLTQLKGVPVDFDYVEEMHVKLTGEIKSLEGKISRCPEVIQYQKKFGVFEPTATEQVLKLMRDICKRDEVKVKDYAGSTGEEVLSLIPASEVPSAPLILEHRAVSKLESTYIFPLVNRTLVDSLGLLHPQFSSMIAETGRLAAQDPNIQNFPKRKRREVRGVIAAPGNKWMVAADYGQIEARVFAMASEDRRLIDVMWTGYDIHGFWADRFMQCDGSIKDRIISEYQVNGDDTNKIRKTFRDEIKNGWVFPEFFGASSFSCARNLKVSEDLAKNLEEEFWDEFQGVKKWQDKLLKFYDKNLYVETLTGRRRRGALSKNQIFNTPIQGTAADLVTKGMDAVSELAEAEDENDLQPNLNVHDDLSFFMEDENMERLVPIIATEMCRHRFDFINVPLIVEVSVGRRWDQLKEIGVYRSNELFNLTQP